MTEPKFKPILRKEASIDFHYSLIQAAYRAIEKPTIFPFQSCINCEFFTENTSYCRKYNSRPPPRVIVFSCGEGYEDNQDIPF